MNYNFSLAQKQFNLLKKVHEAYFSFDEEYLASDKEESIKLKKLEGLGLVISDGGPLASYNITHLGVNYFNYISSTENLIDKQFKIIW